MIDYFSNWFKIQLRRIGDVGLDSEYSFSTISSCSFISGQKITFGTSGWTNCLKIFGLKQISRYGSGCDVISGYFSESGGIIGPKWGCFTNIIGLQRRWTVTVRIRTIFPRKIGKIKFGDSIKVFLRVTISKNLKNNIF